MRPLWQVAPPALDLLGPMPYPALNSIDDALLPAGLRQHWKTDFDLDWSDGAGAVHLEHGPRVPTVRSFAHVYPPDGAFQRIPQDATAFSYRDCRCVHIIAGVDDRPETMPDRIAWARDYWAALHPHSADGAYVNVLTDEGQDRVRATFRDNYPLLAAPKRRWDPNNVFMNQNIRLASDPS